MRKPTLPALLLGLLALLSPAAPRADTAGEFDYYVLALSWSPSWCALDGDSRSSPQCRENAGFGWVLHGLWPQHDDGGWPEYCRTTQRDPSRRETAAMEDIMGTDGAAWHQWRKHGRCSGLTAATYLGASRIAYDRVVKPEVFQRLDRDVKLPARLVEEAFLKDNPALTADMVTVTCRADRIQEVRICLTRRLEPRACGRGVQRDCSLPGALMEAVR